MSTRKDIFGEGTSRYQFSLVENYIYLYHTDTYLVLPTTPENFTDTLGSTFADSNAIARTAPIFSYSHSGPRQVQVNLALHRDSLYFAFKTYY